MANILDLFNRDPDIHLRDARHAHQLFTESNHAFAPKQKFLYHVQFELSAEARTTSINTANYSKEMAVLAKTVDLPQYRASVETVQQYNRKKNIQTRIDYDEIRMTLYDDNTGFTRALLYEYYQYYFRDPSKNDGRGFPIQYDARDKFRNVVYKYGLDNEKRDPFFRWIKIFQLSRQEWFSYTLINPLLTAWGHDSLDYSDGTGIMENTISTMYEGVLYNNGFINVNTDPAGFASPETRYDNVPSPLGAHFSFNLPLQPSVFSPSSNTVDVEYESRFVSNDRQPRGLIAQLAREVQTSLGGIPGVRIPKTNTQDPNFGGR